MPDIDRALATRQDELKRESDQAIRDHERAESIVADLGALLHRNAFGTPEYFQTFNRLKALVPPGIYELHKSTPQDEKRYVVLGVGDHSEDRSLLVCCSALYPPHKYQLVYRPLLGKGGFLVPVLKGRLLTLGDNYHVPRFKFIRPLKHTVTDFLADA